MSLQQFIAVAFLKKIKLLSVSQQERGSTRNHYGPLKADVMRLHRAIREKAKSSASLAPNGAPFLAVRINRDSAQF